MKRLSTVLCVIRSLSWLLREVFQKFDELAVQSRLAELVCKRSGESMLEVFLSAFFGKSNQSLVKIFIEFETQTFVPLRISILADPIHFRPVSDPPTCSRDS